MGLWAKKGKKLVYMLLQSLSLLKRIGLPKNYFILTCLHVFYYSGYIYIGRKKITATGSHSNLTDLPVVQSLQTQALQPNNVQAYRSLF